MKEGIMSKTMVRVLISLPGILAIIYSIVLLLMVGHGWQFPGHWNSVTMTAGLFGMFAISVLGYPLVEALYEH
jgi:uncharacterized membrane protein